MNRRIAQAAGSIVNVPTFVEDPTRSSALRSTVLPSYDDASGKRTGPPLDDLAAHLEFRTEFAGEGYAVPTPECVDAVALARDLEHWKVDMTYSGKALACLVADARSGRLDGQTPVFWQTWNSRAYPAGLESVNISRVPVAFGKFFGH